MKTLLYNLIQRGVNLRHSIRDMFIREAVPTEEELGAMMDDPECWEFVNAVCTQNDENECIPLISPANTALFMTLDPDNSRINYLNESYYRRQIREACKSLLILGYGVFIVNPGTQYGMLAMEELLLMKKSGYVFRVYHAKIFGERRSLLRNSLYEIRMILLCDKRIKAYHPAEYARGVIRQVSIICGERNVMFTHGKVPKECLDYYKRCISAKKG